MKIYIYIYIYIYILNRVNYLIQNKFFQFFIFKNNWLYVKIHIQSCRYYLLWVKGPSQILKHIYYQTRQINIPYEIQQTLTQRVENMRTCYDIIYYLFWVKGPSRILKHIYCQTRQINIPYEIQQTLTQRVDDML